MATVTHTTPDLAGISSDGTLFSWTPLTSANAIGDAAKTARATVSLTYHILGTFGSATVVLEGSLDGTNYFTLKDMDGADISVTAAAAGSIRDLPPHIRPSTSGGGGTQSITVLLFAK
jgi:hypothetical protein